MDLSNSFTLHKCSVWKGYLAWQTKCNIYTVPCVSVGVCVCRVCVIIVLWVPCTGLFLPWRRKVSVLIIVSPSKILLRAYLVYYLCMQLSSMISTCERDLICKHLGLTFIAWHLALLWLGLVWLGSHTGPKVTFDVSVYTWQETLGTCKWLKFEHVCSMFSMPEWKITNFHRLGDVPERLVFNVFKHSHTLWPYYLTSSVGLSLHRLLFIV